MGEEGIRGLDDRVEANSGQELLGLLLYLRIWHSIRTKQTTHVVALPARNARKLVIALAIIILAVNFVFHCLPLLCWVVVTSCAS
jgi:hypothetical protein